MNLAFASMPPPPTKKKVGFVPPPSFTLVKAFIYAVNAIVALLSWPFTPPRGGGSLYNEM